MTSYRVVALEHQIAQEVRKSGEAPGWGHPAFKAVVDGYGPCRLCLRRFEAGREMGILFTYDPFEGLEPYPLPGPIYVHGSDCHRHPEDQPIPDELLTLPLTFNAYRHGRVLQAQERTTSTRDADATIHKLLARPDVNYIHVRNTEAGCYILRLERDEREQTQASFDAS